MRLERVLTTRASEIMKEVLKLDHQPDALLRPTSDPEFGDYQINGVMKLGKVLKKAPRELALPIAQALSDEEMFTSATVAGPGFINLKLDPTWMAIQLNQALNDRHLGIELAETPETIVVDFSSPNIAKQMHVGHLRSTIIGSALVKILRLVGHNVIGDNHLGDWGTQFGLLIVGMRQWGNEDALHRDAIVELERIYKLASAHIKEWECPTCQNANLETSCSSCNTARPNEPTLSIRAKTLAETARKELAKLQQGDPENRALWQTFVDTTRTSLDEMYKRLDIHFDEWLGESTYHPMLEGVVSDLIKRGIAREDDGAIAIFFHELDVSSIKDALPDAISPKLKKTKTPLIIRKRDGAFLYSTTDIATLLDRRKRFQATRSIYVVGDTQKLHFQQIAATAKLLGLDLDVIHVSFGQVLGSDGKLLRTRSGKALKLASLLDEAQSRAKERIEDAQKAGRLRIPAEEMEDAISKIGLGAVKYADLMQNRTTDYKFDWDKMISFQGNASPYLQYQYARIRSIFRKGNISWEGYQASIHLAASEEYSLARALLRFPDVIHHAATNYVPHLICDHLYLLASEFSRFYTNCPVLASEGEIRSSRLTLAALTGRQLELGLNVLGIEVITKM